MQADDTGQTDVSASGVDVHGCVFFGAGDSLENQDEGSPCGTHIDGLEAGVEDQHGLVESIEGESIVGSFDHRGSLDKLRQSDCSLRTGTDPAIGPGQNQNGDGRRSCPFEGESASISRRARGEHVVNQQNSFPSDAGSVSNAEGVAHIGAAFFARKTSLFGGIAGSGDELLDRKPG